MKNDNTHNEKLQYCYGEGFYRNKLVISPNDRFVGSSLDFCLLKFSADLSEYRVPVFYSCYLEDCGNLPDDIDLLCTHSTIIIHNKSVKDAYRFARNAYADRKNKYVLIGLDSTHEQ
jgi:hypothetical protein